MGLDRILVLNSLEGILKTNIGEILITILFNQCTLFDQCINIVPSFEHFWNGEVS